MSGLKNNFFILNLIKTCTLFFDSCLIQKLNKRRSVLDFVMKIKCENILKKSSCVYSEINYRILFDIILVLLDLRIAPLFLYVRKKDFIEIEI